MKKMLVFFFLILPSISNSHPLGLDDNKLDNISNNFDSRLNTTNILKFY